MRPRAVQCTKHLASALVPRIAGLRRNRSFVSFEARLQQAVGGQSLGLIWMPKDELFLDFAASAAVRQALLRRGRSEHFYDRTAARTPVVEIGAALSFGEECPDTTLEKHSACACLPLCRVASQYAR